MTAVDQPVIQGPNRTAPDTGRGASRPTPRWSRLAPSFIRYLVLLLFLIIFMLPFIWIVFWALKSEGEIATSPFALPIPPNWENLSQVWTVGRYSKYVPNTLIYAVSITTAVCFLSCLAGYGLATLQFPGRQLIFNYFLVGLIVPFFSLMIPIYYLARDLSILGTYWGLIIPGTALALPFGIFLMRAFFLALPKEIAEAARIDGDNEWGVFWRVMLPLAGPGLMTLAVFEFLWTWNMFLEPLVLVQRDELRPVGLAILFFQGRYNTDRGMVATGVLLTIVPIVLLYLALQRKFIEGITAGAVK